MLVQIMARTSAGLLLTWPLGTNFNGIAIKNIFIQNVFENVVRKIGVILPGLQCIK